MSAQAVPEPPKGAVVRSAGEWHPTDAKRPRTSKQRKRDLRKDHHRRRRILERAQRDPTLVHTSVRVLDVLMSYSDDTGRRVFPRMGVVAGHMGIAKRSARRCVAELEQAGYLHRYMRPVDKAMNQSNMYYFREPPGPVVDHRPGQRRKPRMRCSDRGTLETAGTPQGVREPSPAGAAKPAPPQRRPGYRRDLPPSRSAAAQPKPFAPLEAPPPLDDTQRQAAARYLAESRALLDAKSPKPRRP